MLLINFCLLTTSKSRRKKTNWHKKMSDVPTLPVMYWAMLAIQEKLKFKAHICMIMSLFLFAEFFL